MAATDARALHRFAAWCVQSAFWWWRWELSWVSTTHIGALQTGDATVRRWSAPLFEAYCKGAWILHWTDDTLYWIGKPRVHTEIVNGRKQLHRADGPTLESDVENLYFWHGVLVPAFVVVRPDWITLRHIEDEPNAEVRRVFIERYGWARYIQDCGARVVDEVGEDHEIVGLRGARLLLKDLPGEPEPIVYLAMQNSTAESDGTFRTYLERIDPKRYSGDAAKLCHAAMASRWMYRNGRGELQPTFEDWRQYAPAFES